LRALTLFATCTAAVLERLNDITYLARLGPNETHLREGDRLDELNVLLSGHECTPAPASVFSTSAEHGAAPEPWVKPEFDRVDDSSLSRTWMARVQ
jgi:hypothetical protein